MAPAYGACVIIIIIIIIIITVMGISFKCLLIVSVVLFLIPAVLSIGVINIE